MRIKYMRKFDEYKNTLKYVYNKITVCTYIIKLN